MLGDDETHGQTTADVLAGALGALGLAAFVCDPHNAVRALNALAEAVVERGILQVRSGRLCAVNGCAAVLKAAIDEAQSEPSPTRSVVLRHQDALEVLDIVPLPDGLLVVVRGAGRDVGVSRALLRTAFGLTPTEAAVALQLAEGECTGEIAARRNVSLGTLRSHIKALFGKIGVNRRAELFARLQAFR